MSPEQRQLHELYSKTWPGIVKLLSRTDAEVHLSRPHLINVDNTTYLNARVRLILVGQQTKGWGENVSDLTTCTELVACYDYNLNTKGSAFWRTCHRLYRELNPEGLQNGFIWANLVRVDEGGQRPRPAIEESVFDVFNVLPDEIKVLRPDVVVFFTGPEYDSRLQRTFPGLRMNAIHSHSILGQLEHPLLPPYSFRTYHPNYLVKRKLVHGVINDLTEKIIRRA